MKPPDETPPAGDKQPDDVPSVIYRDDKIIRPGVDVRYYDGKWVPHRGTRRPKTRFENGSGLFDHLNN